MTRPIKTEFHRRWLEKHRFELYQVGYWLFYGGLSLYKNNLAPEPYAWWEVLLTVAAVMAIIYSIVLILLRKQTTAIKTIALLAGMFIVYAYIFYQLIFVWNPSMGKRIFETATGVAMGVYLFTMFQHWYHSVVEAGLLAAIYRIRKIEKQKRKLLEENHRTQVQFLTAQMDPHEMANLLNIPYAMAKHASGEDMKAIADVLQQVKRRLLYVPEKSNAFTCEVSLGNEVAQCDRIIGLNRKRFRQCFVQIDVPIELHAWGVPLFSVSALLQNALKYGVSWEEQAPIRLRAWCEDTRLAIWVCNKINPNSLGDSSSGIGNGNIRKRLELLYGERASLHTTETTDGWYQSKLTFTKS